MLEWLVQNRVSAAVLGAFIALMLASAWRAGRRRDAPPGPGVIATSFYATFLSTNTFLGQAGFGYRVGVSWMLGAAVFVACAAVAWFALAGPMIRDARRVLGPDLDLDEVTVPRYLREKYASPGLGYLSAGVIFFASILYMAAVFKGVGHLFAQILKVPYDVGVLAVLALVAAYTCWGMIRAILHTDAVQGALMLVGALVLFGAAAVRCDFPRILASPDLDAEGVALGGSLLGWGSLMSPLLILGLTLSVGIKMLVEPRQVVRFLLFRHASRRDLGRAQILGVLLLAVTIPMLFALGVLAHGIIPVERSRFFFDNTDQVVPFLVEHLLGSFWGAMVMASLLCAALSSIDSVLHVAGSAVVLDTWAQARPGRDPKRVARLQRWSMVPVAVLPALVALRPPGDVVHLTALSGALFAGCFFPALVLGLLSAEADRRAALASVVAGGATVVVWRLGLKQALGVPAVHEVLAGLVASIAVYGLVRARSRRERPLSAGSPDGSVTSAER
jgi:Na+/pantothenate symporter